MAEAFIRPATMAELIKLRPKHLRSVQLERDYADPDASRHFVVTSFVNGAFERLSQALNPSSTARAWRLTGDYGAGKSSFMLAFARYAAGAAEGLPPELARTHPGTRLEPVLVVGEREPVARSLAAALRSTLRRMGRRIPAALGHALEGAERLDARAAIEAIELSNAVVRRSGRADGLLIVLDELGKNLEFAAVTPEQNDLQLLQDLAEAAARSGTVPCVVVAVLHQAVTAYARDLASADRREWEKVSGRFEELLFAPPIEQTASLIEAALGIEQDLLPKALWKRARSQMEKASLAGWYGPGVTDELQSLAAGLAPLDPFVLPVLARLLRRFGQSERSLFSFLSSSEPAGLLAWTRRPLEAFEPYRLHQLYDYVAHNLSSSLESGPAATRWGVIDSVVRSAAVQSDLERSVLKSIGLLNLLDDPSLCLTQSLLVSALGGDEAVATAAIRRLNGEARIIFDRGAGGGLCLWPHTSVDLESAFRRGLETVQNIADLVSALKAVLPTEPLVARRHYVMTGAIRIFGVTYTSLAGLPTELELDSDGDGRLLIVLPKTEREQAAAHKLLAAHGSWNATLVVGVAAPIGGLAPALRDLLAWQWVAEQTPRLSSDRLARDEVARQIVLAEDRLRRMLQGLVDFRAGGAVMTRWLHLGRELEISNARQLTEVLSTICDTVFDRSPIVRNELLNRRQLSSAAARARSLLIEGLAQAADRPRLGFDEKHMPPEAAMYLSLLKAGNVHRQDGSDWRLDTPAPDPLRLTPSLAEIGRILRKDEDRRVPYKEIEDALKRAPYGVREGVIPLLVAIYLAINWHRTAVYEEGTYLEQVGAPEFVRMLKESEHFTLQHCAVEGVRTEVFLRLSAVLGLKGVSDHPDLLDVARPLLQFTARLPDHARRTRNLTVNAAAVRDVLLKVQDPSAMLFRDLPRACGLEAFSAREAIDDGHLETFVTAMASAVRELREAYPALLGRVADALAHATETSGDAEALQTVLSHRASKLGNNVADQELKAFILRLTDKSLGPKAWLESLASFLAKKPPERWGEPDEREFHHRLKLLSRRFIRLQLAHAEEEGRFDAGAGETSFRLVITSTDGRELEDFVRDGKEGEVDELEAQFARLFASHGRKALVAAARAMVSLANEADVTSKKLNEGCRDD